MLLLLINIVLLDKESAMSYSVKRLTEGEMLDIYTGPAKHHFPEAELKPLYAVKKLIENREYIGLGMFDDNAGLMAYALFTVSKDTDIILLDYYAVLEEYRSQGTGSIFLSEMKNVLKGVGGILLETEDIEFAVNEDEADIRRRRDSFYRRNGVSATGVKSGYCGVNYNIWYLPVDREIDTKTARSALESLYNTMFEYMKDSDKVDRFIV